MKIELWKVMHQSFVATAPPPHHLPGWVGDSRANVPGSDVLSSPTVPAGERGGSVIECRTPEREVGGSKPTAAVLCPWARYFTPQKYWLITQEAVAPSRHDWKIVDWDVKPQLKQNSASKVPGLWYYKICPLWIYYYKELGYDSQQVLAVQGF